MAEAFGLSMFLGGPQANRLGPPPPVIIRVVSSTADREGRCYFCEMSSLMARVFWPFDF